MAKKKGTRTRAEAKKLMWEYYRDNKASLPKWIGEYREEIIVGIQSRSQVDLTFEAVLESVESDTNELRAA